MALWINKWVGGSIHGWTAICIIIMGVHMGNTWADGGGKGD